MTKFSMVILNISDNKDKVQIAQLDSAYKVVGLKVTSTMELIDCISHSEGYYVLLNATVINGVLKDDCGSWGRLSNKNGVSPRIILSEIRTSSGRIVGYKIINKNGVVSNVLKDDLYKMCLIASKKGVSYVQNGIFRVVDKTASISCYPNRPFNVIEIQKSNISNEVKKPEIEKKVTVEKNKKENKYTKEQLNELNLATQNGVNYLIIANPKLSAKQMRVIWVAKKNGMASEYFNNPKFSVDIMKFFADRLTNKKVFDDCRLLFSGKYSLDQIKELYLAIYSGLNIAEFCDETLPPCDMYVKRMELQEKVFDKPSLKNKSKSNKECVDLFLKTI